MIKMIDDGKISGKIAKSVFGEMLASGASPEAIVREKGLEQVSDTGSIEAVVDQVIAANPKVVADYRGGNEKSFGFFVGQVMKATQGKASPQIVNEILKKKLGSK
jgi:aspartyl-tRNA(Asn)/glutamyl-tRNA(Gln) amidotransferase subunit B